MCRFGKILYQILGQILGGYMSQRLLPLTTLANLTVGEESDIFAMLSGKELLTTRDNKPYFKVAFRDAGREISFPIWTDTVWFAECRDKWQAGEHYKLRAILVETKYGAQLEIHKIRPICEADWADGYDPWMFLQRSRFDSAAMFDELSEIVTTHVVDENLRALVIDILQTHRETLLVLPAATKNHHAYVGGYLEHVLSVTKAAQLLAAKYDEYYSDMRPRLNCDLVIAGAALHDIGKLREIKLLSQGGAYTSEGTLIGHMLQGRDIVREFAAKHSLAGDTLLRLEHIIISHQRLPEWGSPKVPMTPEALLVHYADDIDAKYNMMYAVIQDTNDTGPVTSKKNLMFQQVYRGEIEPQTEL
jgi:3'-5' exoribonuclease